MGEEGEGNLTRNVGAAVLFLPNIKTIKRRMSRKRDVDIGRVFRHKERHVCQRRERNVNIGNETWTYRRIQA
jgi:hypothetical protein